MCAEMQTYSLLPSVEAGNINQLVYLELVYLSICVLDKLVYLEHAIHTRFKDQNTRLASFVM